MLAVAGSAYAACSASATATIENSGDAQALATCTTFSGSIAIATGVADDIALDGIKKLDGNLVIRSNANIKRISGAEMEEITGSFTLDDVQTLTNVEFPKLKTVATLMWNALPNLQQLAFASEITKVSEINIQNTELQSLEGINVETVDKVFIANNRYIQDITMQVGNITQSLTLADNNADLNVTFPNLLWAFNMTFRNVSSVTVPSLETLNDSLGLYGNFFESFAAPNLTEVGGALTLVSNTKLTNISFPQLATIGDNLQVANNTELNSVDGFPKVETISGALDLSGNMTKVDMPALNEVKGAFNLQSSGDTQGACDNFKKLADDGKLKGEYFCEDQVSDPGTAGTRPTGTTNSQETGAASHLNVPVMGAAGLLAAFFL